LKHGRNGACTPLVEVAHSGHFDVGLLLERADVMLEDCTGTDEADFHPRAPSEVVTVN
jgi:hypothetical protein